MNTDILIGIVIGIILTFQWTEPLKTFWLNVSSIKGIFSKKKNYIVSDIVQGDNVPIYLSDFRIKTEAVVERTYNQSAAKKFSIREAIEVVNSANKRYSGTNHKIEKVVLT